MSKENKIIPRDKWVLILPVEKQSLKTNQGLILPSSEEREQKAKGTVEAFGDEVKKDIKKGDIVIYGVYAGENIEIMEDGKKVNYILLLDEDIIAFVK